jgi:hypothetical protein
VIAEEEQKLETAVRARGLSSAAAASAFVTLPLLSERRKRA